MLKWKHLKYWLLISIVFGFYSIQTLLPGVIPYELPKHLQIISYVIMATFCMFLALVILSYLADDMWQYSDSIKAFGTKRLWGIWSYLYLVPFFYSVYKWENKVVILISIVLYLGLKCVTTNHNKHVKTFKEKEILRKARQEQAEEVNL